MKTRKGRIYDENGKFVREYDAIYVQNKQDVLDLAEELGWGELTDDDAQAKDGKTGRSSFSHYSGDNAKSIVHAVNYAFGLLCKVQSDESKASKRTAKRDRLLDEGTTGPNWNAWRAAVKAGTKAESDFLDNLA